MSSLCNWTIPLLLPQQLPFKMCPCVDHTKADNSQYQLLNGPSLIGFTRVFVFFDNRMKLACVLTQFVPCYYWARAAPLPLLPAAWLQVEMSHKQTALTIASYCFTGCFWNSQLWLSSSLLEMKKKQGLYSVEVSFVLSAWFWERFCSKKNDPYIIWSAWQISWETCLYQTIKKQLKSPLAWLL